MARNGKTQSSRSRRQRGRERVGEYVTIYLRGRVWWAEFVTDRKQQRVSLDTRNKKEARRRAIRIEADLLSGKYRPQKRAPLIQDAVKADRAYVYHERRRDGTLKRYGPELERFAEFAAEHRVTRRNAVSAYPSGAWRVEQDAAPATLHHETIVIKQFVNYAFEREMISKNPLKKMKLKKPKPSEPVAFTLDEVEAILTKAHDRYRPIFEVRCAHGHAHRRARVAHLGGRRFREWLHRNSRERRLEAEGRRRPLGADAPARPASARRSSPRRSLSCSWGRPARSTPTVASGSRSAGLSPRSRRPR
jgi:hypothetical protein